jgi:outer membrane protein assembly factor BamB
MLVDRVGLASLVAALCCVPVFAETRLTSGVGASDAALRRAGLVRAWQTQIEFDANRGKLAGVTQHVSSRSAQTIYEVTYPGGRITFSDRDLDAFRKPLGPKGAKAEAELWIKNWKARSKSKEEPAIKEHVVPDVVLVATSERGLIQCLNGETGRTLWTNKVGSVRHPTTLAAINEKFVAVINGSTLYLMDRADGHIIWERPTTHPAGNGPAMSDDLIFVPIIDGHVEIFHIDEPRRPAAFYYAAGRCVIQPVVFRDAVAWPTDRANLYVGNSEVPGVRFRITAKDSTKTSAPTSIRSAPTFRGGLAGSPPLVFFASADGYVYSADTVKGAIVNRFSAGEPISQTPVAVQDQVYVVTDLGTLFCAGADDAQERWFVPGVKSFLAANFERVYGLDTQNRVMSIEAATGAVLGVADVGRVDYSFVNTQTDRIIVGTETGVLQCLHELRRPYPLVHGGMEPKKKLPQVIQKGDAAEGDSMEGDDGAAPATTDEDPFGAEPAPAKKPKEAMPAEEDNPFG